VSHASLIYLLSAGALFFSFGSVVVSRTWRPRSWRSYWLVHASFFIALCVVGGTGLTVAMSLWWGILFIALLAPAFWLRVVRPWRHRHATSCAYCGRELSDVSSSIQVGDAWFCSEGHRLDYEARPRRAAHRAGLLSLAVVVIVVAVLAFSRREGMTGPPTAPAPAQARDLDREAMAVVNGWARAEFVAFDCDRAKSFTTAAAAFVESSCRDNQAEMLKNRSKDRHVTLEVKRGCQPSELFAATYKAPHDCVLVTSNDIECGLSSSRTGQVVTSYWAPGSVSTNVFLARVHGAWRIVGEDFAGMSGGGKTRGTCTPKR
jgi:hypothetical protein